MIYKPLHRRIKEPHENRFEIMGFGMVDNSGQENGFDAILVFKA